MIINQELSGLDVKLTAVMFTRELQIEFDIVEVVNIVVLLVLLVRLVQKIGLKFLKDLACIDIFVSTKTFVAIRTIFTKLKFGKKSHFLHYGYSPHSLSVIWNAAYATPNKF